MTKDNTVRKNNLLALKKEHCGRVEVTQKCPFMTTLRTRAYITGSPKCSSQTSPLWLMHVAAAAHASCWWK